MQVRRMRDRYEIRGPWDANFRLHGRLGVVWGCYVGFVLGRTKPPTITYAAAVYWDARHIDEGVDLLKQRARRMRKRAAASPRATRRARGARCASASTRRGCTRRSAATRWTATR